MEPLVESRAGLKLQLQRIVDALRQALGEAGSGPELLAAATTRIRTLPDAEPDQLEAAQTAMRTAKAAALADLGRLAREYNTVGRIIERWRLVSLRRSLMRTIPAATFAV